LPFSSRELGHVEDESVGAPADDTDLLSTPQAGPAAVRGGTLRLGSFMTGAAVNLVAAAVLFRYLGVRDAGRYTTALALAALVTGLTDLGLTAIGMREYVVLDAEGRRGFARNLLGIRLALTSIGVAAITLFAFIAYGHVLGLGVLVAGVGVLLTNVQLTLAIPLMATLRLGLVSLLEVLRLALVALLIVVLVIAEASLIPFLATVVVAAALALIPTAIVVRGSIPLTPSFAFREWKALLGPVLTYSLAVAAGALYFRIAIVLVSLLAGSRELGYFSASYRVVEGIIIIPGLLVGAAFPIFARAARDDVRRLGYALSRVFEVSCILGVWVALALGVGAHLAIQIIGGAHFLPATKVLAVQGVAVGATFVSAVWAYGMLSLHMHRLILAFNISMLVLVAGLVSALVPLDNAQGAAIGVSAAEVLGATVAGVALVHRRAELRPRLRVLPRVALAAALGVLPAAATGLPVAVRVVLSTIIYVVVLIALKAPPAELYEALHLRRRGGEDA
jgi:O-antigen/teichoic acid export membrane protein